MLFSSSLDERENDPCKVRLVFNSVNSSGLGSSLETVSVNEAGTDTSQTVESG